MKTAYFGDKKQKHPKKTSLWRLNRVEWPRYQNKLGYEIEKLKIQQRFEKTSMAYREDAAVLQAECFDGLSAVE